ncbi:MAG: DNA repair protein RecO [Saprospiraceae bacterium]
MIYHTRAIVLRSVKFGESSLIVDMYTEQKGHQTFIINSVRKAKSITPPSYLQLLTLVDIVAYHQDHKKINRIKEVRLDHTYQSIPFDMRKSSVITCLAEITYHCLSTAYPQPDLFSFLHKELIRYDQPQAYDRDFLIRFLVSLSHYLGFGFELPVDSYSGKYFDLLEGHLVTSKPLHDYVIDQPDLASLKQILDGDSRDPADVRLPVRRKLIDILVLYFQLHVETLRNITSLKILREIL